MMKTMMIGQGLDPQKNRNKCKLIWDSSSGARARARSQNTVPTAVGLIKAQASPKIQFTQRPQNVKATVVPQKSVAVVALESSHGAARRRSISNVIADRMSKFEETKAESGNIKKKKKSVQLQVKS